MTVNVSRATTSGITMKRHDLRTITYLRQVRRYFPKFCLSGNVIHQNVAGCLLGTHSQNVQEGRFSSTYGPQRVLTFRSYCMHIHKCRDFENKQYTLLQLNKVFVKALYNIFQPVPQWTPISKPFACYTINILPKTDAPDI